MAPTPANVGEVTAGAVAAWLGVAVAAWLWLRGWNAVAYAVACITVACITVHAVACITVACITAFCRERKAAVHAAACVRSQALALCHNPNPNPNPSR